MENLSGSGILELVYQNCKSVGKNVMFSTGKENSSGGILELKSSFYLNWFLHWSFLSYQKINNQRFRSFTKSHLSSTDKKNLNSGAQDPEFLSYLIESLHQSSLSCQKTYNQRFTDIDKGAKYSSLFFA